MKLAERIDRFKLFLFKLFVMTFAALGAHGFLARFCSRYVTELSSGGERPAEFSNEKQIGKDRATVLVLDIDRFRGDVTLFAENPDIRILSISWNLLRSLLAAYAYLPTKAEKTNHTTTLGIRWEFALAGPETRIYKQRKRYRAFLRQFLPHFLKGLGVDVVMNSDHRYRRESDFTRVASELDYPHLNYYREAMYIVPSYYELAVDRHEAFAPFLGDVIAVQNKITKQMFIDSGMVDASKVMIRGCPRMDGYLKKIVRPSITTETNKTVRQIAYFSSPRGASLFDWTYFEFISTSKEVVRALAELARDDEHLRVVLKMKDMHIKGSEHGQMKDFTDVIAQVSGSAEGLPNVIFETGRMAAQDIILGSEIICGMQSTVVLEAAIAGKPVILPHFRALREAKGATEVLMYQEFHDLFDVPDNAEALKDIVRRRLDDPHIDPAVMEKRRAVFEEHVSPLSGNATETSLDLIRALARKRAKT